MTLDQVIVTDALAAKAADVLIHVDVAGVSHVRQQAQDRFLVYADDPAGTANRVSFDQGGQDSNAEIKREAIHNPIIRNRLRIVNTCIVRLCNWTIHGMLSSMEPETPGELISLLLAERGWDQKALAAVVAIDPGNLNRMIAGKRRLDAFAAIALSDALGVPAERFLNLQQANDLATARTAVGTSPERATRAALFGSLPITEMIHRGWLNAESVRDVAKIESELTRFFGVTSVAEIEILPHAAKKTNTTSPVSFSQLAWIYRVQQIARGMVVARPYSRAVLIAALEKLKALLRSAEEARKVPRILAEAGVRFVIVESLKSAKMDGVCFWINATSPVIGMSLRFDRIDNFWFVLIHEIEHVLRGHGRVNIVVDAELEGDRAGVGDTLSNDERIANQAAANFCVPANLVEKFIAIKAPMFSQRDVLGFAAMLGVHPGLIVGQLQRRTGRYDLLRNHLARIRSIVSPGAIVDGWGDVAPVHV